MICSRAEAAIARGRALVGTRFVSHGRDPARGLDCVGLIAAALDIEAPPPRYALRCGSMAVLAEGLQAARLIASGRPAPGDVLAFYAGPGQLHLGLWTGGSLIHADAGLRRVVERPGEPPWPMLSAWRLPAEGDISWRR